MTDMQSDRKWEACYLCGIPFHKHSATVLDDEGIRHLSCPDQDRNDD